MVKFRPYQIFNKELKEYFEKEEQDIIQNEYNQVYEILMTELEWEILEMYQELIELDYIINFEI